MHGRNFIRSERETNLHVECDKYNNLKIPDRWNAMEFQL